MVPGYARISVIIPHYKDKKLPECLKAIREKTTYGNYNLVVAEDVEQKGIARNMNKALKESYPSDVIKMDAHTLVLSGDWLWTFVVALNLIGNVGAIAPLYTASDGVSIRYSPKIVRDGYLVNIWKSGMPVVDIEEAVKVDVVSGACVLYTREALDKVGGYNMIAGADTDLCLEIRKAGFDIWVLPKIKVWHSVGSYTNMKQHNMWLKEGMPKFIEKWGLKQWDSVDL